MDPNKNAFSLDKIDRLLVQIEKSLGLQERDPNQAAENLYSITRELYFSVPQTPDQDQLSEEERDTIFQEKVLGRMSKSTFIKRSQARIKSVARAKARAKEMNKQLR